MKNAGNSLAKLLLILGVIFGLLGLRSFWRDYTYRKASVVVKAKIFSAEIKDIRTNGNYYLKPTHHITHHFAFLKDGIMDTLTDKVNFLLYTEGRYFDNPNPIPTVEQLMKQDRYVRYVPKSKRNETAFPDRIDINNNGEYTAQHSVSFFYNMLFCFVAGGILSRFFRSQKSEL